MVHRDIFTSMDDDDNLKVQSESPVCCVICSLIRSLDFLTIAKAEVCNFCEASPKRIANIVFKQVS